MSQESHLNHPAASSKSIPASAGRQSPCRFDRVARCAFLLTTLLTFTGYWVSLAPNVTLEMSGAFSTGAMYAGVPHQPGYPAWTLYSWLWTTLLPWGNITWRVAFGSAVAAAVACGLVAGIVAHLSPWLFTQSKAWRQLTPTEQHILRMAAAVAAGCMFGFSQEVWSRAVLADPWAFGLLLFTGLLSLLVRWSLDPGRGRSLYGTFFLFGLLLSSHQHLLILFPALAFGLMLSSPSKGRDAGLFLTPLVAWATKGHQYYAWFWVNFLPFMNWVIVTSFALVLLTAATLAIRTRQCGTEIKTVMGCALAFVCGLAFYLYVPLASMTNPPMNWGYARSIEGYQFDRSRGQYERAQSPQSPFQFAQQAAIHFQASGKTTGWISCLVALLPLIFWRKHDRWGQRWLLALLAIWLCTDLLLLAVLNPAFSGVEEALVFRKSSPYFAPANAIFHLGLGWGWLAAGTWFLAGRWQPGRHSPEPLTQA